MAAGRVLGNTKPLFTRVFSTDRVRPPVLPCRLVPTPGVGPPGSSPGLASAWPCGHAWCGVTGSEDWYKRARAGTAGTGTNAIGRGSAWAHAVRDWYKRYKPASTLWHTRRRCGGAAGRETGATRAGVQDAAKQGMWHTSGSETHWGGGQDVGRPALPTGRERGDLRRRTRRRLPETGLRHTRRGQVEDQAKASWRTRAGAIGGGSAVSFRCRRIFVMISPCVIVARIRSAPC